MSPAKWCLRALVAGKLRLPLLCIGAGHILGGLPVRELLWVVVAEETGSMTLKPLGDRVVVEREEAKETTAGGIVLPDTAKDKPQKGKVLAVGDGRITKDGKRRELQVKVGEHVLFTSYAGEEFKIDGDKKVLLMREEDILAVIG
jgi:chaperonin GroES